MQAAVDNTIPCGQCLPVSAHRSLLAALHATFCLVYDLIARSACSGSALVQYFHSQMRSDSLNSWFGAIGESTHPWSRSALQGALHGCYNTWRLLACKCRLLAHNST